MIINCWVVSLISVFSATVPTTFRSATKNYGLAPPLRLKTWQGEAGQAAPVQIFSFGDHSCSTPLAPRLWVYRPTSGGGSEFIFGQQATPLQFRKNRASSVSSEHNVLRPDLNLFGLWEGFSGYTPGDHQAIFSTIYSVGLRFAWRLDAPLPGPSSRRQSAPQRGVLRAIHGPASARARTLDTFER